MPVPTADPKRVEEVAGGLAGFFTDIQNIGERAAAMFVYSDLDENFAWDMLDQGKSEQEVHSLLVDRGVSSKKATDIIKEVLSSKYMPPDRPRKDKVASIRTPDEQPTEGGLTLEGYDEAQQQNVEAGSTLPMPGGEITQRAKGLITRFQTTPFHGPEGASTPKAQWDEPGLLNFAERLYLAGYITGEGWRRIKAYGPVRYLDVLEAAATELISDADAANLEPGAEVGRFFADQVERGRRHGPDQGQALVQESTTDLEAIVRQTAMSLTGGDASEEQIQEIINRFRQGERTFHQEVQEANAMGGLDPANPEIEKAPSIEAIASEEFLRSEEGLTWSILQGIQKMRSALG